MRKKAVPTSKSMCMKCKYHTGGNNNTQICCYYLVITGKRRKCKVGMCNKFEAGECLDKERFDEAYRRYNN